MLNSIGSASLLSLSNMPKKELRGSFKLIINGSAFNPTLRGNYTF